MFQKQSKSNNGIKCLLAELIDSKHKTSMVAHAHWSHNDLISANPTLDHEDKTRIIQGIVAGKIGSTTAYHT